MWLLAVFCFLALSSATQHFEHIKNVDIDALPSIHQSELWSYVEQYFEGGVNKRVYTGDHPEGFFQLRSVTSLVDGEKDEHHFVLKPVYFSPEVHSDYKQVHDIELGHIFNGYSSDDLGTVVVMSMSRSEHTDGHPLETLNGMVHHSDGRHFRISHSAEHGVTMTHFDVSRDPVDTGCKNNHEHDGHHDHDHHAHEEEHEFAEHRKEFIYKRSILEENEVEANGLTSLPLLQIEIAVLSDVGFASLFPAGVTPATNYVATVLAAINVIYERDFYGTLVFQYFGFYTQNAPVFTADQLTSWLSSNPAISEKADVATVLQGNADGGLGYVGTVCGIQKTSECGVNGLYGTTNYAAPNDVIVIAHEIGHILGSRHTHDVNGYSPVIDNCGNQLQTPSVIPSDGGSIMSYCHAVSGGAGYAAMNLYMGAVGKYGVQSERVNRVIRTKIEAGTCISSTDPNWSPTCTDYTPYTYSDGTPIVCAKEVDRCDSGYPFISPPYCQKTCGRCATGPPAVNGAIPLGPAVNCVWSAWSQWSLCSQSCGTGDRRATRTVVTPASNGGVACSQETMKIEECNTQSCAVPVNCVWGEWTTWTGCSELCGTGHRSSTRSVATPASNGGADCTGISYKDENCNTQACAAVACTWNPWSAWGSCSAACGAGTQTRTRTINTPASNGGTTCVASDSTSSQACTGTNCTSVDCAWGDWGAWSTCTAACGTGSRTATRTIKTQAENSGAPCGSDNTKSEPCNTQSCAMAVDCTWAAWGKWSQCSVPCGSGTVSRSRKILTPGSNGGYDCDANESTESAPCEQGTCTNVDCAWGAWEYWSECTASCGTGTRTISRSVTVPAAGTGKPCESEDSYMTELCNTEPCAADCQWGAWSAWGVCTQQCGSGSQTATRSIVKQGTEGGSLCNPNDSAKFQDCNTQPCTDQPDVDCVWSTWTEWGACSPSCGPGTTQRYRTVKTQSSGKGKTCDSVDSTDFMDCNAGPCVGDCVWGEWGAWGTCDKTCGTGFLTRTRPVKTPATGDGSCNPNLAHEGKVCNTQPCDCAWTEWGEWGQCSKTCAGGTKIRTREVSVEPTPGGTECDFNESVSTQACNTQACTSAPVNCAWSAWGAWTACSATCGGGTRSHMRTIATQASNDGADCLDGNWEEQACNTGSCPATACQWGAWQEWGACSKTCGSGTRLRNRPITAEATNGGVACKSADSVSSETCNTAACPPVDCTWSTWSEWGFCSKSCGTGTRVRSRSVLTPAANGGVCDESNGSQNDFCNTSPCTDAPVDCVWSAWNAWSECSEECDGGVRTSTRTLLSSAQNGGECTGVATTTSVCNTQECPASAQCTDNLIAVPVKRDGEDISCLDEALRGNCGEWYMGAPYCAKTCGWFGCRPPCDDLPNPGVIVKNIEGVVLDTCPKQASAGLCNESWMSSRTCRKSCGRCGSSKTKRAVAQAGVEVTPIESELKWEDTYHVYEQGTDCTLNKGMPSFEVYEEGAPQSYVVAADDLVVPAGKTIFIDQIHLATRWTPLPDDSIPEDEQLVEVRATIFYNGTVRCRMTVEVYPKPLIRLNVSAARCFLSGAHEEPSGFVHSNETYWLTVTSFTNNLKKPLLYWGFSETKNGEEFRWKDPADYLGKGLCPTFSPGTTCGVETFGVDMCFRFIGYEFDTTEQDRYFASSLPLGDKDDGEFGDGRSPTGYTPGQEEVQDGQRDEVKDNKDENAVTYGPPTEVDVGDINDLEFLAYVIPLIAFFTIFGVVVVLIGLAAWQRHVITRLWNADDYSAFSDFE
eukprot:TRINITY_DN2485_c0_g1_i1.p1 TRINITY_DN2485_c0_g1~~TRINITY_DN2485_c0_g1_i1.p1  ORF type:complete len:1772 (+),score=339.78 TRINITY_DN2485_c0_g1_i1:19-5334(+)